MDDARVANPFYRHSDTWPRKGRRLIEAVAAAFKAAFLAASQRAHNSPSAIRGITGRKISKRSMTLINPQRCSHPVWDLLAKAELERGEQGTTSGPSVFGA